MKKLIIATIVALGLMAAPSIGMADLETYKSNVKEGLWTMAKSPKPLIDSVKDEYNAATFKPFGVVGGTLKGSLSSIKQFSQGLFKTLTFNVWEDNFWSNYFEKEQKGQ